MRTDRSGSPRIDELGQAHRLARVPASPTRSAARWLAAALLTIALSGLGCATIAESITVTDVDGSVTEYRSRLWIVGGGQTEFISGGDGTTAYSTNGTGLSDNGRAALEEVAGALAEGAVKGLVPIP
jgi:hypothetical protein